MAHTPTKGARIAGTLQEPISKGVGSCYRYSCVHGYSDHGGYRGHALGLVQSSEFIRAYNSKPTKFVQAATPSTPESQLAQTCTEQSLAPWVKRGVINVTSRGGIAAWGRYFSAVPATLPTIAPPLRIGWFLHHINQLELYMVVSLFLLWLEKSAPPTHFNLVDNISAGSSWRRTTCTALLQIAQLSFTRTRWVLHQARFQLSVVALPSQLQVTQLPSSASSLASTPRSPLLVVSSPSSSVVVAGSP